MDNLKTRKKYQNNYADYDKQRSLTVNRTVGLLNLAICGKEIKNTTRKIVYKVAKYVYKYNEKRFAQFARRVWDIVEEDDKVAAEPGIKAMSDFEKIFYTIDEAAELLRVHRNTIYTLVRSKQIEHYRVGNQIRITAKELERLKVERST